MNNAVLWTSYQLPDANPHYLPDPAGYYDLINAFGAMPKKIAFAFFCDETGTAGNLDLGIQFRPDASWNGLMNNGYCFYVDHPPLGKFSTSTGKLTAALTADESFVTAWISPMGSQCRVWVDATATIDGSNYWNIQVGVLAIL